MLVLRPMTLDYRVPLAFHDLVHSVESINLMVDSLTYGCRCGYIILFDHLRTTIVDMLRRAKPCNQYE